MKGTSRAVTDRLASLLLRLYPASFRRRFQAEWSEVVGWHRARLEGARFAGARLALLLVRDALGALPAAYASAGIRGRARRLDGIPRDVRHALRGLARHPVFSVAAALSLALGIGANTAVFTVVDAVLVRPLPYPDPGRLVVVWNEFPGAGRARLPMSGPQLESLRQEPDLFEEVAGVWATSGTVTDAEGRVSQVRSALVTPNLFRVLGIEPALGPGFVRDASDVPEGVVLGHELWRTAFGGDPGVVGRSIRVDGRSVPVAGVLPAGFRIHFPEDGAVPPSFDLYTPLPWDLGVLPPAQRFLRVIGRLRPGVDPVRAAAGVAAAGERALATYPELEAGDRFTVHPLHADSVRAARPVLLALVAAVGLFLLLACANVANLLLARTTMRLQELAIRMSLGSSRSGLARLLIAESLLLTAAGGAAGLVLGRVAAGALWALRPDGLARADLPPLDGSVLLFTLAVSGVVAVAFGLTALAATRAVAPAARLRGGATPSGPMGRRFREGVTAAQVAVGLVLLVGSALMIQSVVRLGRESVGFDPHGVLTFKVALDERLPSPAAAASEIERRIEELPDVVAVGGTSHLPFASWANWAGVAAPVGTPEEEKHGYVADLRAVTPGFFDAARVQLVRGRSFDAGDDEGGQLVVVVDEAMARRAFGDADPLGRTLEPQRYLAGRFRSSPAVVVGVLRDLRDRSPGRPSGGQVFWPYAQSARWELTYMVRAAGDPRALVEAVRREVRSVDPELAISEVRVMDDYVREATALTRFVARVGAVFSALAVLLAAVGLYGVVAFVTAQRLPELGLRSVLGASRSDLLGKVLGQGLRVAAAGVVAGAAAALGLTRFLRALVYGVSPYDPVTLAAAGALLLMVAAAASLAPAVRASRVDPARALREG